LFGKNKNSEFFIKKDFNNKSLIMKKSIEYELILKSVNLRIFDTNIGILTFNIENKNHCEFDHILEINDFTRRIYPEYLDYEKEKSGLVPEYIKLGDTLEEFKFEKDLKKPKISKIIEDFLPTDLITPAVDDRMFTICFCKDDSIAEKLKNDYHSYDDWYKYIFVDGDGKTVQNDAMQKELIQKATYNRWQQYGTMYGISKYSFVCLSNSDFPLSHMKTMYFSMFSLLLMVRATILKFSHEVSQIANNLDSNDISSEVQNLYERYIKFVNHFYFREITAKDQGLELYEKAIDILKIERDIKDLDAEIEELFKYVEMQRHKYAEIETEKTNKKLNDITLYGGILLGASVLTGFFGMNVGDSVNYSGWLAYPLLAISTYLGYKKFKGE
jgi:hypothetical protein